jgi:hypothetical protein
LRLDEMIVPCLREGLLTLLAADAELMAGALVTRDWRAHEIAQPRARTERCWSLLDSIGWHGDPATLVVGAREHGATIREACAAIVPLLEGWLTETPPEDPRVVSRIAVLDGLRDLAATLA